MARSLLTGTLVGIAIVSGCTSKSTPTKQTSQQAFVFIDRMGVASWRDNQGCLAIFNARVERGTKVTLVDQQAPPETSTIKEATVVERLSQACDVGLAGANSNGVVPSFYHVASAVNLASALNPLGIMVAILDPPGPFVVRDGQVDADLDGDGVEESFRSCLGAENVHFMAWTGSPPHGEPRWHGLYYLGYDVTPSCSDQEVAGMVALEKRTALVR
jgi:hypothetical protein